MLFFGGNKSTIYSHLTMIHTGLTESQFAHTALSCSEDFRRKVKIGSTGGKLDPDVRKLLALCLDGMPKGRQKERKF